MSIPFALATRARAHAEAGKRLFRGARHCVDAYFCWNMPNVLTRFLWNLGWAVAATAMLLAGCRSPYELQCDDLLEPAQTSFVPVRDLVSGSGAKACSRCHGAEAAVRNLDFSTPAMAYDSLRARSLTIYEQVASGEMPLQGERWNPEDLRALRSWYCHGAPYAP